MRFALVGLSLAALSLSACATDTVTSAYSALTPAAVDRTDGLKYLVDPAMVKGRKAREGRAKASKFDYDAIYAARQDGDVSLAAFDHSKMSKRFLRQRVRFFGPETPGTIVVDATSRHLYLVEPGGMAIRYGIAVGKEGFAWTGNARLQRKTKWPTWTPPREMIQRKPELEKYAGGMPGGAANPLGSRAMYLFQGGRDTLYRIHGTTKPYSIGKAASSGCFRMINHDAIDLYSRVGTGGKVLVRSNVSTVASLSDGGR